MYPSRCERSIAAGECSLGPKYRPPAAPDLALHSLMNESYKTHSRRRQIPFAPPNDPHPPATAVAAAAAAAAAGPGILAHGNKTPPRRSPSPHHRAHRFVCPVRRPARAAPLLRGPMPAGGARTTSGRTDARRARRASAVGRPARWESACRALSVISRSRS